MFASRSCLICAFVFVNDTQLLSHLVEPHNNCVYINILPMWMAFGKRWLALNTTRSLTQHIEYGMALLTKSNVGSQDASQGILNKICTTSSKPFNVFFLVFFCQVEIRYTQQNDKYIITPMILYNFEVYDFGWVFNEIINFINILCGIIFVNILCWFAMNYNSLFITIIYLRKSEHYKCWRNIFKYVYRK